MPTIRTRTALAAGGVNGNVLAGNQFEFLGGPARVRVAALQTAGTGVGEVEVFFGQEIQLPQAPIGVNAGGRLQTPDDYIVDDFGAGGDRLVVRLAETGGLAGATIDVLVQIDPIPMG